MAAGEKLQKVGAMRRGMTPAFAGHVAAQVALTAELLDPEIDEPVKLLRIEERPLSRAISRMGTWMATSGARDS